MSVGGGEEMKEEETAETIINEKVLVLTYLCC